MMWAVGDHKYFDIDFISIVLYFALCYSGVVGVVELLDDDGVIKIDLGHVFVSK